MPRQHFSSDVNFNASPIFGQALPLYAWFYPKFQNFIEQLAPLDSVVNFERLSAGHGCDTSWPKLNLMLGDVSCIIWRFWPLPIHFTCTCGFLGPMRSTQVLYNLLKIFKVQSRQASLHHPMLEWRFFTCGRQTKHALKNPGCWIHLVREHRLLCNPLKSTKIEYIFMLFHQANDITPTA